MDTKEHYWITSDKNFSLKDIEGDLPAEVVNNEIFDIERPLTKLTLFKSLFKQEPIAQILYDETYHKYIIVEDYNADISRHLADTYSYYMNNVGTELEKDSGFTYEHMILALGFEMGRYIEDTSEQSEESN